MSAGIVTTRYNIKPTRYSTLILLVGCILFSTILILSSHSHIEWRTNIRDSKNFPRKLQESSEDSIFQRLKGRIINLLFGTQPSSPIRPPFVPRVLGFGKKGIGLTLRSPGQQGSYLENLPKVKQLDVFWNYAWQLDRIAEQPDLPMFVPMAWGGGRSRSDFQLTVDRSNVQEMIQQGKVKFVLGFNEPDSINQSNMLVSTAIDRWPILMDLGVPLVSPSCKNPTSIWMSEFMALASALSLRVNYFGVHWYGGPNINTFINRMTTLYNLYKLPLIITEFAVFDGLATTTAANRYSPEEVLAFMKQAIPWMEQTSWIAGYSWFSFKQTSPQGWSSALFDSNGNLTPLGQYYKNPF